MLLLLPRFHRRLAKVQERPVRDRPSYLKLVPALSPHVKDFTLKWRQQADGRIWTTREIGWKSVSGTWFLTLLCAGAIASGPVFGGLSTGFLRYLVWPGAWASWLVARALIWRHIRVNEQSNLVIVTCGWLLFRWSWEFPMEHTNIYIHDVLLYGIGGRNNAEQWHGKAIVLHVPDQAITLCMRLKEEDVASAMLELPPALHKRPPRVGVRILCWSGLTV